MKRIVCLCLAVAGLLVAAGPVRADIGTVDALPAATLLLPYFEVDLEDPEGITTLFSINNASDTVVLAHVVVWSDLSVPVLDFNIFLTGYDVQTVNLRDILVDGLLPQTAPGLGGGFGGEPGPDPFDRKGRLQGVFSPAVDLGSCANQLPPPDLPAFFIEHLQSSLTGQSSPVLGNRCAGRSLGDRIARGYVTVDTVSSCTLRFPGDAGYFVSGGLGDATNDNVLWGDYFYAIEKEDSAQGETLVHIEADAADPETSVPGQYTFYGRYVGWTAADNREPLATTFATRFVNGGVFGGGTDLLVWRDSKVNQGAFTCPALVGRPSWFFLGQEAILVFDEEENVEVQTAFPVSPVPPAPSIVPFPAEVQRVGVGLDDAFPTSLDFGWLYLNLNTTVSAAGDNPPEDPAAAQAWVTTVMAAGAETSSPAGGTRQARGRFSVGFDAIQLDNASAANHQNPGEP